jgi:hypothetical protein
METNLEGILAKNCTLWKMVLILGHLFVNAVRWSQGKFRHYKMKPTNSGCVLRVSEHWGLTGWSFVADLHHFHWTAKKKVLLQRQVCDPNFLFCHCAIMAPESAMCQRWHSDFNDLLLSLTLLLLFLRLQCVPDEASGLIHFRIKFRNINLIYNWYDSLEGSATVTVSAWQYKEVNAKFHAQSESRTHNTSVRDVKKTVRFLCNMANVIETDILAKVAVLITYTVWPAS